MSSTHSSGPVVVTRVATEPIAAIVVARLRGEGIEAQMSGALTSAYRAEGPGDVAILVRPEDLERARALLAAVKKS